MVIGKKTKSAAVVIFNGLGALITAAIGISVAIAIIVFAVRADESLQAISYVLMSACVLLMGLGCAACVINIVKWARLPDVLLELDEQYLYIRGKNEKKFSLFQLKNASVYAAAPNALADFFAPNGYGTLRIEVEGKTHAIPYLQQVKKIPPLLLGIVVGLDTTVCDDEKDKDLPLDKK